MNNYDIEGSVILITGASGQLGQSLVNAALKAKAKVICLDLSLATLKSEFKNGAFQAILHCFSSGKKLA